MKLENCEETKEFLTFAVSTTPPNQYKKKFEKIIQKFYSQISIASLETFIISFIRETNSKTCNNFKVTEINKLFFKLKQIHETLGYKKRQINPVDVVIIGAGPIGLLTALQTYGSGSTIRLFEKRKFYTRNTWLDLYPRPYSLAYDIMMHLGFTNDTEHIPQKIGNSNESVITIRTKVLEEFLFHVAKIIGIEINFERKFLINDSNDNRIKVLNLKTNKIESYKYNVLIGADGTKSDVREFQKFPFTKVEEFQLKNEGALELPGLSQLSFLVNFDSVNGKCPELKDQKELIISDPWMIGFEIPSIHSLFKRWYNGHCQLQILFLNRPANQILENFKKDALQYLYSKVIKKSYYHLNEKRFPLSLLFKVLQRILKSPPKNYNEMLGMIKFKKEKLNFFLLKTEIRKIPTSTKITQSNTVVSLVGDASITAHYRLGIGINNGFLSFHEKHFTPLLKFLNHIGKSKMKKLKDEDTKKLQKIVEKKIKKDMDRINSLVQYQISTIFYESYCNYIVFGAYGSGVQDIYGKDFNSNDYFKMTNEEVEKYCGLKKKVDFITMKS
eukprot:gene1552-12678_t